MLEGKRLGVVGLGKLGEALVTGLLTRGTVSAEDVEGTVRQMRASDSTIGRLGIRITTDNQELVRI